MRAKPGPKRIELDWEQFDKLCELQCTLTEIASWFNCSPDTIENRCNQDKGMRFSEYFEQKRGKGKIALRRMQMQLAKNNAAMAIFLGKNWLNQTDKWEQSLTVKESNEEARAIAKQFLGLVKSTSDMDEDEQSAC